MAAMRDAKRRAWRPRERRCEDGAVAGGGGRLGGGDAYGKGGGAVDMPPTVIGSC